jgi:hypothetical protein
MLTKALQIGLVLTVAMTGAELRTAVVEDPRPLAKALEYLENLYGLPITYEDPPYVHPSEITDATEQIRGGETMGRRILIPRGGSLSFSHENLEQPAEKTPLFATSAAINGLLAIYQTSPGPQFAVIAESGCFHIVPTRFTDRTGQVQNLKPILDSAVSLPSEDRTAVKLLVDLCDALSRTTGQTLIPGNVPYSLLARHKTALPVSNIDARSVLNQLFAEIDRPLSWQLFYDPGLNWYVLNIHSVRLQVKEQ